MNIIRRTPKIIMGENAFNKIYFELNAHDSSRPIIVISVEDRRRGILRKLKSSLKNTYLTITSVTIDVTKPSDINAANIARHAVAHNCNSIVGIGDSYLLDVCKLVKVMIRKDEYDVNNLTDLSKSKKHMVLVSVPTGIGNQNTALGDINLENMGERNMLMSTVHALPEIVVVDKKAVYQPENSSAKILIACPLMLAMYSCGSSQSMLGTVYARVVTKYVGNVIRNNNNEKLSGDVLHDLNAAMLFNGLIDKPTTYASLLATVYSINGLINTEFRNVFCALAPFFIAQQIDSPIIQDIITNAFGDYSMCALQGKERIRALLKAMFRFFDEDYNGNKLKWRLRDYNISEEKFNNAIAEGNIFVYADKMDKQESIKRVIKKAINADVDDFIDEIVNSVKE